MARSVIRPLLALTLVLCALGAEVAHAGPKRVLVVVSAQPGERGAAERLVARLGGEVGAHLGIVGGFTARVPERSIARLRRAASVRDIARDVPLQLSSTAEHAPPDEPVDPQQPTSAAPIDLPPAEIPTDAPPETVAGEVINDAAEDASVGSLDPDPVDEGEDAPAPAPQEASQPGQEAVLDPTAPVEPTPQDAAARARASLDAIRAQIGIGATALTGAGVDVALIDSGVIGVGPLGGEDKLVRGPDFSEDAFDPELRSLDTFGHGSHMAGVIAGDDPASGYRGIAPGARVVSVKVSGADGLTSLVRVLMALDWVRRHRDADGLTIRVLNLSLGVDAQRSYVREPLAYATESLWQRGIAVVAAAGNQADGTRGLDLPAADPFVIAVGASRTGEDDVADFSSRDAVRPPDVVAPGTGVVSLRVPGSTLDEEFPAARIGDDFFRGNGTSQAAAVVSGLVALLLEAHPGLEPDQVKALLRAGAVDLADDVSADGQGRVDLEASLAAPVPSVEDAAQPFAPAVLDLAALWQDLIAEAHGDAPAVGTGENGWKGRRWSGRRWSGRRWSGRRWSGSEWGANGGANDGS